MRTGAILAMLVAFALAGCGGGSGNEDTRAGTTSGTTTTATPGVVTGKLPPGAVGPVDTHEEEEEGPAATEASPGEPAQGPKSQGELPSPDRDAVTSVVSQYISALDRHDGGRVCSLVVPGALRLYDVLPKRRGGCGPSLQASIGTRPRLGGPAWRKTSLVEVKTEDIGDGRARVVATVTHHFSDRRYVSVEDDDIYLEQVGDKWLLAKPSGTLYRAVGYESPPLEAFRPPPGWH
jgi:hypothetical protein